MNNKDVWNIKRQRWFCSTFRILTDNEKGKFLKHIVKLTKWTLFIRLFNRQNYIDQGQSVNLMVHPNMSTKEINKLYIKGWELGLKSLYYQHPV